MLLESRCLSGFYYSGIDINVYDDFLARYERYSLHVHADLEFAANDILDY